MSSRKTFWVILLATFPTLFVSVFVLVFERDVLNRTDLGQYIPESQYTVVAVKEWQKPTVAVVNRDEDEQEPEVAGVATKQNDDLDDTEGKGANLVATVAIDLVPAEEADLNEKDEVLEKKNTNRRSLTSKEITEVLEAHNDERSKLSITPLRWSDELAASAGMWATELKEKGCVLEHSNSGYGENIYYSRKYGSNQTPRTGTEVIDSFLGEKRFYDDETHKCEHNEVCGHYTQIVWAGTTHLGCAKSLCLSDEREEIWVCHYNPPGNVVGMEPY